MGITYLAASAQIDDVVGALDRDGVVILTELLPAESLDQLRQDVGAVLGITPNCEGHFWGKNTTRSGGLAKKSRIARDMILHPTVLGAANEVLGPFCDRIQLNLTQAIQIHPGERAQVLHKDDEVFPLAGTGMECIVNALWAVDDFTRENGATQLVVGSHKTPLQSDEERFPDPSTISYAEMPAGSVLLYRASLLHSGGANVSDKPRTGVAIGYSLGWLRQAENQYLAYPPEVAREMPPELQALIGYEIHRPNLGWYEGQSPKVVLEGKQGQALATQDHIRPEVKEMLAQLYDAA